MEGVAYCGWVGGAGIQDILDNLKSPPPRPVLSLIWALNIMLLGLEHSFLSAQLTNPHPSGPKLRSEIPKLSQALQPREIPNSYSG